VNRLAQRARGTGIVTAAGAHDRSTAPLTRRSRACAADV
jgi:hypothetical protein